MIIIKKFLNVNEKLGEVLKKSYRKIFMLEIYFLMAFCKLQRIFSTVLFTIVSSIFFFIFFTTYHFLLLIARFAIILISRNRNLKTFIRFFKYIMRSRHVCDFS